MTDIWDITLWTVLVLVVLAMAAINFKYRRPK